MENFVYFKANSLVKAKYEMTSMQNKLANLLFFKSDLLGKYKQIEIDDNLFVYKVSIQYNELNDVIKKKMSFKDTIQFIKDMTKIDVYIYESSKKYSITSFIFRVDVDEEEKNFVIYIFSDVYNAVKDKLHGNFTPLDLNILNSFKSIYSQRLYENLRAWTATKKVIDFKVDYLKQLFFIQDKYKRYNDFKKDCLSKAIDEINKSKFMKIHFEEIKQGRKIDTIRFTVKDNVPRQKENKITSEIAATKETNIKRKEDKIPQKTLNFTNYSQREYDYDELEKQLLGWDD